MRGRSIRSLRVVSLVAVAVLLPPPSLVLGQSSPQISNAERSHPSSSADSPDERRRQKTLRSVVKLDDHPLYEMKYYGGYTVGVTRESTRSKLSSDGWGCSLFAALADKEHPIFGRNFDWYDNPALVLLTDSPDGFASISMVDVSYLGFGRTDRKWDSIEGLSDLLGAPEIPFDGMNEHGLAVGMAAVDGSELPHHPHEPTVGSLGIIRLILDQCRTVGEGIALFEKYNIDFSGGPQIHYLLADANGDSALVELADGKVNLLRGRDPWMAATNFYVCGNEGRGTSLCRRFARIENRLKADGGLLSAADGLQLLNQVAQESTRWSVVYDLKDRTATIVMSRQFERPTRISLDDEKPRD